MHTFAPSSSGCVLKYSRIMRVVTPLLIYTNTEIKDTEMQDREKERERRERDRERNTHTHTPLLHQVAAVC